MSMRSRKGFSFVEVIVSLAIFSLFSSSLFILKTYIIKQRILLQRETVESNLQNCILKTFLNRYAYDELLIYKDEIIYTPLDDNTIYKIPVMKLNEYTHSPCEKQYISIGIREEQCIIVEVKLFYDDKLENMFTFAKGRVYEERIHTS
ncbi:prepilin-type N-terminal cleavage/methylation domain-containing protein [Hathewaya proteolytica DSM 3090]|uniref:Prepilin-type N-terminal cleavage/methylation domain-containing protein n=1 Tax=Hathewaya proteolytica DSM 3090 TaxID=1121331 RepID=A0A1M6L5T4_9CLOT|nr:type II secretion system protein [Hathewaya proteolytica]SHJ66593.1 prepilin-type N-terminal cleavage/methylation domain-containing protein [Hathewaya proteolytica DSM 3090]